MSRDTGRVGWFESLRLPCRGVSVRVLLLLLSIGPLPATAQESEATDDSRAWSNKTELAFVETGGNAESRTLSVKNRYAHDWERSTLTVDAHALRADSTERTLSNEAGEAVETAVDKVTAEQYGLTVKYDRQIDERLGWFAFGGWKRNQLAGIDDRYNLDGGISYRFLDSERQSLVGEAGLGFTDEAPLVGPSESFLTTRALARYERSLSATSGLETELEAIQNTDRSDDHRINWLLGVTAKINGKLALKASYTVSYDGDPATRVVAGDDPGEPDAVFEFDSTDTVLSVSLVIDF